MHPQEFKNRIDYLCDSYYAMSEELHRVKMENKLLTDEINRIRLANNTLNARISAMTTLKVLKMGAGWYIDGEPMMNISLMKKFKYDSPICNAKMSKGGQILFTCNKKIFLFRKDEIFEIENDQLIRFDPKIMNTDLTDFYRNVFDFFNEDMVIYQNSKIKRFEGDTVKWTIDIEGVICICTDNDKIYVGTNRGHIYVYGEDGTFLETLTYKFPFESFIVRNRNIISVSEIGITVNNKEYNEETGTILSYDADDETVIYISDQTNVRIADINTLDTIEIIPFKKQVLSVGQYKGYLIISTADKVLTILNLETKSSMKMVLPDNVIDILCNDKCFSVVDNNGGLNVWQEVKE